MLNAEKIRAIVLAGTHRWGESALEAAAPRALLPVLNAPVICHVLRWLHAGGVAKATICANNDSRHVRAYLGDGGKLDLALTYFEDRVPRGPAGCARDAMHDDECKRFIVSEACIVPQVRVERLLAAHAATGAAVTVVVERVACESSTQGAPLQPAGVYIFDRGALARIPATGFQDIKEMLVPQLRRAGLRVATFECNEPTPHVTNMDTYLAVNAWMLERIAMLGRELDGYRSRGEARIHAQAHVSSDARLVGPVLLGPGSRIGPGATIVGPTAVGAGCSIGQQALISRSVLWDDVCVSERAALDSCILTDGARVGTGEQVCETLRLATGRRDGPLTRLLRLRPRSRTVARGAVAGSQTREPIAWKPA